MLELVAVGLAAWRVTAMLSFERGPWDIFLKFRRQLGIGHDDEGVPDIWPDGLAAAIVCPWCLGVWVTAAMWLVWQVAEWPVMILAAAALLIVIHHIVMRLKNG